MSAFSYGELGSMVIYQTLHNMFSHETLRKEKIAPLSITDFIQQILVPEVAMALVRVDMDIDDDEALKTLRASSSYGAAMFPVTDKDGEGDEVHDKLVKERARAKRKEIEKTEGHQEVGAERSSTLRQHKLKVDATLKQGMSMARPARRKKPSADEDDVGLREITVDNDTTSRITRSKKATKKADSDPKPFSSSSQTLRRSQVVASKASTSLAISAANIQTPPLRSRPRPRRSRETGDEKPRPPKLPWESSPNEEEEGTSTARTRDGLMRRFGPIF